MPSVRVLTSKPLYKRLGAETRKRLANALRTGVAQTFSENGKDFTPDDVEVLWLTYREADNACDVSVEVLFSRDDTTPAGIEEKLAEAIVGWLKKERAFQDNDIKAVWIRPQPGAVFRMA